jgi:Dinucleotide-utilizing enzymes involved in molybdopterin and thiamine biosynthesis family 2
MNNESRQSFLGDALESRLESERPSIVGLCGGGSHVGQQLAHIGFRHIGLYDFDHVEESNLTRMIGSCPADARNAELKTNVIKRLINGINPSCEVTPFEVRWQNAAEELRQSSIIFGCVDNITVREELERFARKHLIPYIDVGMDVHESDTGFSISGQVAVSLPNRPCLRCMGIVTDAAIAREHQRYGDAGGRPQVVWPNGVLASTAVGLYMSMILPWAKNTEQPLLKEYDGNRHEMVESRKTPLLHTATCRHHPPGRDLGDPFFSVTNLDTVR